MPIFLLMARARNESVPTYYIIRDATKDDALASLRVAYPEHQVIHVDQLPQWNGVLHSIHFLTPRS